MVEIVAEGTAEEVNGVKVEMLTIAWSWQRVIVGYLP
jgi:hypothetical protein